MRPCVGLGNRETGASACRHGTYWRLLLIPAALLLVSTAWGADYPLPPPPMVSTAAPAPAGTVPAGTVPVEFAADRAEYDSRLDLMRLTGGVRLTQSSWTIRGEDMSLHMRTRSGLSRGRLLFDDGVSAVYAESGEFDFADRSGRLKGSSAVYGDWRLQAREARLEAGRRLDYRWARFTSCDNKPAPHYHFRASRVTVVPKRYFLARNAVYFLGDVPVFYMPFLYKSLKEKHLLSMKFQPGYDRRNGAFLKGTLDTQHTPHFYSKLYLDYYSSQGLGTGAELGRQKGEDSRGVLYGYRIRETHNGRERWTGLGNVYQELGSSRAFAGASPAGTAPAGAAFQGRLQVQSDADFNNHYARSRDLRVTPELVNSAALVYRFPRATARLSYSRLDTAAENRASFDKERESAPRLDVQSAALRIGRLPWLNTFSGFADNSYDRSRAYLEKSAGAGWEGARTFPLAPGMSFAPLASYRQTYFDRVDSVGNLSSTHTVRDVFIGRYALQGTLRAATGIGDWDLTHRYERRQKADTFSNDVGAPDHGVERQMLSLTDTFRPSRRLRVSASGAYDFRVFRDRSLGFRDRVQPFVAEIVYTPRPALDFTMRDEYQLEQGNRSLLFSGQWGEEGGDFFAASADYNRATPENYFFGTRFGVAPSSGSWAVSGALRADVFSSGGIGSLSRLRFFEKELVLVKHWHDFHGRVLLRLRPGGVKELSLRLDMKFGNKPDDRVARRNWESEWFPERASGGVERP